MMNRRDFLIGGLSALASTSMAATGHASQTHFMPDLAFCLLQQRHVNPNKLHWETATPPSQQKHTPVMLVLTRDDSTIKLHKNLSPNAAFNVMNSITKSGNAYSGIVLDGKHPDRVLTVYSALNGKLKSASPVIDMGMRLNSYCQRLTR